MLWAWMLSAWAVTVDLRVEPDELVVGQTGAARLLLITGRGEPGLQSSRPPPMPSEQGLMVSVAGQAQQFRQVGGQITAVKQFEYRVQAVEQGTWSLGPVTLRLSDGSEVSTDAVTVEVKERSAQEGETRDVVVEAGFDTDEAYEGQVVVYRYRLETRLTGASAEWQLPRFDGLRQPQTGQPDATAYVIDDPDGTITVEEGVVPLVAVATGEREQGAAIAHVRIPSGPRSPLSFRPLRREPYATRPTSLEILPLPTPPDDFSGLVGEFTLRSELDKTTAAVGESVNWTVQIAGSGALEGFSLPEYEVEGASVYENDSRVVAGVDDGAYAAAAAFRRVLVPTDEGVLQPPPLQLVTFSPEQGRYVTHELEVEPIRVTPGREGDGTVTSFAADPGEAPSSDEAEVVDFRDIRRSGPAGALPLDVVAPLLGGLLALPGLGLLLLDGGRALRRRLAARARVVEGPRAASSWLEPLPSDPLERLAALSSALRAAEEIHGPDPRLRALQARVGRARFSSERLDDPTLEQDVRDLIASLEAA